MTIENLKQIAIKYASTKGSRIPLAPDELCNAVVQYMNSFFSVMTDINTIKVAVTEDSGNIVFTITGNTYDGKPITPIVITVDHNDFVTDQEFEEFKTTTNAAIQKNTESINSLSFRVEDTENDITTIQVQVGQINTRVGNTETDVTNLKNRVDNTETNIAKINSTLNNKLDKITSPSSNFVLYANIEGNDTQIRYASAPATNSILYRDETGKTAVVKGVSGQDVANMENLSDITAKIPDVSGFATTEQLQEVENKIPDTSNLATKTELQEVESKIPDTTNFADVTKANTFAEINTFNKRVYFKEMHFEDNDYNIYNTYANNQGIYSKYVADVSENMYNIKELGLYYYCLGTVTNDGMFHEFLFPNEGGTLALTSDIPAIPEYTSVDSVIYDTTNGAIIAYNGANEIHIPLLAGENVTIDASEDNKKIVISAAGGGGTGDVTAAGNNTFTGVNTFNKRVYFKEIHFEDNDFNIYNTYANNQGIYSKYVADVSENMYNIKELGLYYYCLGTVTNDGMFHEFLFPNEGGTLALTSDIPAIPEYTSVDSVIYDTTNGAIIAYNGANEIHIPLLAGENVTIDASEDNKKIVISAAGGGGTGDVTAAGNNTFTGVNTFNNSIYAKNGVVAENTTNYGANSIRKGPITYSFPNKSGTFAMTTDIIKEHIYFISFYANDPGNACHLIGTMMSKNSYGTGQKTNEEFAVMLADNLYTNINEGLAVYGKLVELTEKDIICIYSDDGLSIRCLDETNSDVYLPTVMFFVMETEL